MDSELKDVLFSLGGMWFEYNEEKNLANIRKHGISFKSAARVFFDYDRIELFDEENSEDEERYNIIGDTSAGLLYNGNTVIGNVKPFDDQVNDILFVVYTERVTVTDKEREIDVIRLISARLATSFERGLYYGKYK